MFLKHFFFQKRFDSWHFCCKIRILVRADTSLSGIERDLDNKTLFTPESLKTMDFSLRAMST